jgi:hypothetical protein
MGFSLGNLLQEIGERAVGFLPGGEKAKAVYKEIPSLIASQFTQPAKRPQDEVFGFPDALEKTMYPERFPTEVTMDTSCPQIPVTVVPEVEARHKAPPGYVIVECPKGSGNKVAMLKPVAMKMKYWRPRRKPPIKASDWRALQKADSTIRKLKTVVKKAGVIQKARGRK